MSLALELLAVALAVMVAVLLLIDIPDYWAGFITGMAVTGGIAVGAVQLFFWALSGGSRG